MQSLKITIEFESPQSLHHAGFPVSMSSTRSATNCRSDVAISFRGRLPPKDGFGIRSHLRNSPSETTAFKRATCSKYDNRRCNESASCVLSRACRDLPNQLGSWLRLIPYSFATRYA